MDRERDAVFPAVCLDFRGFVVFADHAHEADARAAEIGSQRTEHGGIVLSERAGGMEEGKADGPALGTDEIGERNGSAIGRLHREAVGRQGHLVRPSHAGDEAGQQPQQGTCPHHGHQYTQSPGDHGVGVTPIKRSFCRRESFLIAASRLSAKECDRCGSV